MVSAWTWATASPRERGMWVRENWRKGYAPSDKLRELFNLTEVGLFEILNGEDWRPEHEAPTVNYLER